MQDLPTEIPFAVYRTEKEEDLVTVQDKGVEAQDVVDCMDLNPKDDDSSIQGGNDDRYGLNLPPMTSSAKELRAILYAQRLEFYALKGKLERETLRNQFLSDRLGSVKLEAQLGTQHLLMSCANANVEIPFEEVSLVSNHSSSNSFLSSFPDPTNF